jgi:hypothetical protein
LTGDIPALRLCLDRIMPARKDRPVTFEPPPINSAQDAAIVTSAMLAAVAMGELTPADAGEISRLIDTWVKAFETAELAERLERLEKMTNHEKAKAAGRRFALLPNKCATTEEWLALYGHETLQ